MAYKTMLRQLISKWGIMSIDMIQAIDADMAVIHEDGTKDYVETENIVSDQEADGGTETQSQANPEIEGQATMDRPGEVVDPSMEAEPADDVAASFFS